MNLNGTLVEFFGTTIFLYVIIATGNPWLSSLTLALLVYFLENVSGAYFNPAVTIMMVAAGRESKQQLIPYIFAQLLGALVALQLYRYLR